MPMTRTRTCSRRQASLRSRSGMTDQDRAPELQNHVLDGCNPDDLYKTMMSERTELVKARRESEDNLVKTIIQLSATLIVLISGFVTQTSVKIYYSGMWILAASLFSMVIALCCGLSEHIFSSKAYFAQQMLVEKFYTKQINEFSEPYANKWVRRFQAWAFFSFVTSLVILSIFAFSQTREKIHEQQSAPAAATTTSSPAASTPATAIAGTIQ